MSRNDLLDRSALLLLIVGMGTSNSAHAAGFEKSLTWSARAAGQAGAVVGTVTGAEALFFNPSGLAATSGVGEVSLNFSPTFSKFTGANPYQYNASSGNTGVGTVDGETGFSPVGALLGSYRVGEKLGVGVGFYVSGGTKAKYENLSYTDVSASGTANPFTLTPTVETDVKITEAALGAGYELLPGLRVGGAWRVVMVNASLSTVGSPVAAGYNPHVAISNVSITGITATRWNGYKLGAQYESPTRIWGAGASYRSGIDFIAKNATTSGTAELFNGTPSELTPGTADLANSFPEQINIGGYAQALENLRVSAEFGFTKYSSNKVLVINGTLGGNALANITQNWGNQKIGRIGFEYTGFESAPLRFGYAYTSQVTPSDYARSTFSSPGSGHAIGIGSGYVFSPELDFDVAGEYSFAKGTGHNANAPNPLYPEVTNDSEFTSHAFVAHLSAKFRF